jgi:hypothetical protein
VNECVRLARRFSTTAHGRGRVGFAVVVATAALGLAACGALVRMQTPSPQGPRISTLEFLSDRGTAGCPVKIRFRFEAPAGDLVRVVAGWARSQRRIMTSGYSVLPLDVELFSGKTSGEVVVSVTPDRHGTYWYQVQVQDRAGHWSNVLKEGILVDARWPEDKPGCS